MKYLLIWSVLAIVLCGCHRVAVQTDHNDASSLAGLKTYGWLQTSASPGEDVRVNNLEVNTSVVKAVDRNLTRKGYQKVESGPADFLVTWFGAIEKNVKVESIDHFYKSHGYGAVVKGAVLQGEGESAIREYEEGTILIDILNPLTHEMLWRGTGTKRIPKEGKEGDAGLYINNVVTQILENLPTAEQ